MRHSMFTCLLAASFITLAPPAQADELKPGLLGEYFALKSDLGESDDVPAKLKPHFVRIDKQVNFSESGDDFHGSKLSEHFLVQWTGVLRAPKAGRYAFHTTSDDGSRLYINGKRVVENWGPHSMSKKSGEVELAAGDHAIRITYTEISGGAGCIVGWTPPGGKEEVLPASALFHRDDAAKKALTSWDKKKWEAIKKPRRSRSGQGVAYEPRMGPVVTTAIDLGDTPHGPNIVYRAIVIPLADDASAGVVFDADTLRMAGGWTDGALNLNGLPFTGGHGSFPSLDGEPVFQLHATPGWANAKGELKDPRAGEYPPLGHLPKDWAHYKGLYMHGDKVVLKYTVGDATVHETPSLISYGEEGRVLQRTVYLQPRKRATTLVLATAPDEAAWQSYPGRNEVQTMLFGKEAQKDRLSIGVVYGPQGAKLAQRDGKVVLDLPASDATSTFHVIYRRGKGSLRDGFDNFVAALPAPEHLEKLTKPGPQRSPDVITTQADLADEDDKDAYVIDRLTVPFGNKYEPRMRIGGMDLFSDGTRAAVSTWDGDVWIVSGIKPGKQLGELKWKRFASGLHEPLGLKIVDDVIYTVDDMQITRFHDYNDDGEADYYENFNNDWELTSGFHAFCFDLHTDAAGNFYFAFGSPVRPGGGSFERMGEHHGSIIRVSKDGSKLERYATGLRAPNGMGVSPSGQVTSGDNEGTFVPRCPIHWIDEGEFLGVVDSASAAWREKLNTTAMVSERVPQGKKRTLDATEMPKPLAWLPKNVDNSGGGQVWVTSEKWGPFNGELLHMSYGQSSLYLVLKEKKTTSDGEMVMQGGVVKLPLRFTSSAMRARFNPLDGQLYVAGLKGWQSNAAREGGFDRVRYTGKPVYMPNALRVKPNGVEIGFTQKLDPELANDADSFAIRAADIRWTHGYGSGEYQIGHRAPGAENGAPTNAPNGWTTLKVKSAKLLPDGKTVFVEIPDIQPVHEMEIRLDLEATDGTVINTPIHNTIHAAK